MMLEIATRGSGTRKNVSQLRGADRSGKIV